MEDSVKKWYYERTAGKNIDEMLLASFGVVLIAARRGVYEEVSEEFLDEEVRRVYAETCE